MKLNNLNDQLMAVAAHRYCLGRRSYIVGACLDWLRDNWEQFSRNTRRVMVLNTIEALMDSLTGDACDVKGWRAFAAFGLSHLNTKDQEWIKQTTAWKNKPWPLVKE